jgi:protein-S-isoprenylcysteine O-methyltransferase Ste14
MVLLDVSSERRSTTVSCERNLIEPFRNLPIGAAVLVILSIFLKIKGAQNKNRKLTLTKKLDSMDPLGCLIFISTVCCLLLALEWGGQTKPWNSPTVISLLVLFVILGLVFAYLQWRRKDRALIPIRVLKKRSIYTSAMVLFFLGASNYLVSSFRSFTLLTH